MMMMKCCRLLFFLLILLVVVLEVHLIKGFSPSLAFVPKQQWSSTTRRSKQQQSNFSGMIDSRLFDKQQHQDEDDEKKKLISNNKKNEIIETRGGSTDTTSWFTLSRRRFWTILVGIVLSLPLVGELYSRLGRVDLDNLVYPILDQELQELTLVFHGAGGPDINTDALMKRLQQKQQNTTTSLTFFFDWSQYSSNVLQASFNGQRIGTEMARRIQSFQQQQDDENNNNNNCLKRIHVIGISVGAFAANQLVDTLQQQQQNSSLKNRLLIQETLLDPFCGRGILGLQYGIQNYGINADYAQQYLNTDDPVPTTNDVLPHCHVIYNVTALRPPDVFGHDWPLIYYTTQTTNEQFGMLPILPDNKQQQRGVVIQVK